MRIQILGTAAAEGWPGLFCDCDTCARARAAGEKDFRSRASIQIDDIYKIDLPPDTYYHSIRFGLRLPELKYLFFTHSHGDHFAPAEIEYLRPGFAHNVRNAPVKIYGSSKVISVIKRKRVEHADLPVEPHEAQPFVAIEAGHLTFIPIVAEHSATELCYNYVVQSDRANVLYASDTGLYGSQTMDFLSNTRFDLMIVECTQGTLRGPAKAHMSLAGVLELRKKLSRAGAVGPDTRWVITHFSHNIGLLHAQLQEIAGKHGIEVAYDGITLEA